MPKAALLLRETLTSNSLTNIVEKSQNQKPPFLDYELQLNSSQLDLTPLQKQYPKLQTSQNTPTPSPPSQGASSQVHHHDEGFESDIDSLSLISSDESFTSSTCLVEDHVLKHQETDSANGSSSSSESDTENTSVTSSDEVKKSEKFPLSDVICYTDVSYPKVLVFVIKSDVLVFHFDNLDNLQSFYTSFNTLKAVTNQRTYGNNVNSTSKFNLLQRTDSNGVTHIEISREATNNNLVTNPDDLPSGIISLNTPEASNVSQSKKYNSIDDLTSRNYQVTSGTLVRYPQNDTIKPKLKSFDDSKVVLQSELRSSRSEFFPNTTINSFTLKPRQLTSSNSKFYTSIPNKNEVTALKKLFSRSKDDLKQSGNIDDQEVSNLKKVWKSAESLLDEPKRPERRRKQKGRAPPPPVDQNKIKPIDVNVMKGQFVRVAVDPKKNQEKLIKTDEMTKPNFQTFSSNIQTFTPNWNSLKTPQSALILSTKQPSKFYVSNNATNLNYKVHEFKKNFDDTKLYNSRRNQNWTNSVPRLLKKQRSKSETRQNQTPMAYRYIDTTQNQSNYSSGTQTIPQQQSNTISNRLFGLSQKLKEFGSNVVTNTNSTTRNFTSYYDGPTDIRRNSLGEMTYKSNSNETNQNLKSVIKKDKDDSKKKSGNEKKVTFSAYATVQVV